MFSYKLKYILLFSIAILSLYILYNKNNKEYFINEVEKQDRKIEDIELNIKKELEQEIKKDMHESVYCVRRTAIPSSLNINKGNTILGFGPNVPFINKYDKSVQKDITPTPDPYPDPDPDPEKNILIDECNNLRINKEEDNDTCLISCSDDSILNRPADNYDSEGRPYKLSKKNCGKNHLKKNFPTICNKPGSPFTVVDGYWCEKSNTPQKWSCSDSGEGCIVDPEGEYNSVEECENSIGCSPSRLVCDKDNELEYCMYECSNTDEHSKIPNFVKTECNSKEKFVKALNRNQDREHCGIKGINITKEDIKQTKWCPIKEDI